VKFFEAKTIKKEDETQVDGQTVTLKYQQLLLALEETNIKSRILQSSSSLNPRCSEY
jgi:hypothetical protein